MNWPQRGFGFNRQPKPCPDCSGQGVFDGKPCARCKMRGTINAPRYQTKKGRTACWGGCKAARGVIGGQISHHSAEEAAYCNQLSLQVKAKQIHSYRGQVRYEIHDRLGGKCTTMIVDFEVMRWRRPTDPKGQGPIVEIHEYKGKGFQEMPEYKMKRALFTWCYPHIEYHTIGPKDIVL